MATRIDPLEDSEHIRNTGVSRGHRSDVSITSDADAQALAGIRVINGDLAIDASSSQGPSGSCCPGSSNDDDAVCTSP